MKICLNEQFDACKTPGNFAFLNLVHLKLWNDVKRHFTGKRILGNFSTTKRLDLGNKVISFDHVSFSPTHIIFSRRKAAFENLYHYKKFQKNKRIWLVKNISNSLCSMFCSQKDV